MYIGRNHYKCCGCCSMTTATLILGALYLIGCIFDAIAGMWLGFAIQLIMSLLFIMVLVKPHDVTIRKILYYLVMAMIAINFVGLIIVFIFFLVTDDWILNACHDFYEQSSSYWDQD